MSKKIRPLYDRLLVEVAKNDATTPGGIILPESANDRAQIGTVIAVGPGRLDPQGKTVPMQVKQGDMVFFGKYAGTDAGDNCLIVKEDEVLGIVER